MTLPYIDGACCWISTSTRSDVDWTLVLCHIFAFEPSIDSSCCCVTVTRCLCLQTQTTKAGADIITICNHQTSQTADAVHSPNAAFCHTNLSLTRLGHLTFSSFPSPSGPDVMQPANSALAVVYAALVKIVMQHASIRRSKIQCV